MHTEEEEEVQWQRLLTYICPICTCRDAALHCLGPRRVCLNYNRPVCTLCSVQTQRGKGAVVGSIYLTNFSGNLR